MSNWYEYEVRLTFDRYFIQGVSYGENEKQALRGFESGIPFTLPEPLETEIRKTAIMEEY